MSLFLGIVVVYHDLQGVFKYCLLHYNADLMSVETSPFTKQLTRCNTILEPEELSEEEYYHWKKLLHSALTEDTEPRQSMSLKEMEAAFPKGNIDDNHFILDNGSLFQAFDDHGRIIEQVIYKRSLPGKTTAFDATHTINNVYDNLGYLITRTEMEIGKIGYTRTYEYVALPDHPRILRRIITQEFHRQGVMEPGPNVGKPQAINFF